MEREKELKALRSAYAELKEELAQLDKQLESLSPTSHDYRDIYNLKVVCNTNLNNIKSSIENLTKLS